ncbi:hypothetical protein AOX55_0000144 [Sinorhizobium fredii CCBAU 25509]|nr:hypothetical protein AOX55_0000144 [Sinorhizobium fredii CCBAU 25509]
MTGKRAALDVHTVSSFEATDRRPENVEIPSVLSVLDFLDDRPGYWRGGAFCVA